MVDPVALPILPEIGVTASHLFCDQDGEVTQGMSRDVEVGSYWFLCSVTFDVTAVSIEADMAGILCFSHSCFLHLLHSISCIVDVLVLQVAVARMWKGWLVVVLINVSPEQMCWQVRQCWLPHGLLPWCGSPFGQFELGADQKVAKVLWSVVGHNGGLWNGLLEEAQRL